MGVALPDGTLLLYPPFHGSRHDAGVLRECGLLEDLRELNRVRIAAGQQPVLLLGDKGFPTEAYVIGMYRNPTTEEQHNFNNLVGGVRVTVEKRFKDLKTPFSGIKYPRELEFRSWAAAPTSRYALPRPRSQDFQLLSGGRSSTMSQLLSGRSYATAIPQALSSEP